ncbi:MAG: XRE family transcriptional regulator [Phototrophicales bacterium]|nr:MAG: XRE family transcriptional regulator [Phototrophicales bacterium]
MNGLKDSSKDTTASLIAFGQMIRTLRKARGWSQDEFAAYCNMHRTYIGSIERGEQNISLKNIVKISRALNMRLSELFENFPDELD